MASSFTSHIPGFGSSNAKPQADQKNDETSLTTLLSADQCADLTFLIATITATMRKSLLDTFTAEEAPSTPTPNPAAQSSQEKLAAAPANASEIDVEKEDKLKKEKANREEDARKELAKPEVQELKKEMLRYFDEWRGKVIGRVGEVVNSREEARAQAREVRESDVRIGVKRQDTGMKSISDKDMEAKGQDEKTLFRKLYPPFETGLAGLEEGKRALVLHSLVLILLSLVSCTLSAWERMY
jgi:hypothetical protein